MRMEAKKNLKFILPIHTSEFVAIQVFFSDCFMLITEGSFVGIKRILLSFYLIIRPFILFVLSCNSIF